MSYEVRTEDGQKVAFDELALFFNNETILYGWQSLKSGMSKDEALQALTARGFSEHIAEAFLKQMRDYANILWQDGRLVMPSGEPS